MAFVDDALAQLDILLDDQDAWIANHTQEVRELVRKHQAAQEAKSARKCVPRDAAPSSKTAMPRSASMSARLSGPTGNLADTHTDSPSAR